MMMDWSSWQWPVVLSACADCGVGTITLGEFYMVRRQIWEKAWAGRRRPWTHLPGQEILCIGCLEARIGRTLTRSDFSDVPVNDINDGSYRSDRLRDRLIRKAKRKTIVRATRRTAPAPPAAA